MDSDRRVFRDNRTGEVEQLNRSDTAAHYEEQVQALSYYEPAPVAS